MKTRMFVTALTLFLAPCALALADDTVTLTDGSVLKGQVMEETSDHVTMMDHGMQRTLERSMISKVEFNTSPTSAPQAPASATAPSEGGNSVPGSGPLPTDSNAGGSASGSFSVGASVNTGNSSLNANYSSSGGDTVPSAGPPPSGGGDTVPPAMPTQEQQDYALGVSDYYHSDPEEVWGYEDRGISYEELPVVYYIAQRAGCGSGLVVNLRTSGLSWSSVCMRLGLSPAIFYWDDMYAAQLDGPYGDIFFRYHHHRRALWLWDTLLLSDADIINLVNLHFTSVYWHRPYWEVAHYYGMGHPYFYIGFGYSNQYGRPYYAHHGNGWGGNYAAHYNARVAMVRSNGGQGGWQGNGRQGFNGQGGGGRAGINVGNGGGGGPQGNAQGGGRSGLSVRGGAAASAQGGGRSGAAMQGGHGPQNPGGRAPLPRGGQGKPHNGGGKPGAGRGGEKKKEHGN